MLRRKRKQERVKRIKAPIMEKLARIESAQIATDPKCANQATSPTAILSATHYMTQVRRFLRHRTGSAADIQPLTVMLTRDRDGMASSRKTGCRNTVTRTLPLGAVPTAFSHRTMISSRIRARRVAWISRPGESRGNVSSFVADFGAMCRSVEPESLHPSFLCRLDRIERGGWSRLREKCRPPVCMPMPL